MANLMGEIKIRGSFIGRTVRWRHTDLFDSRGKKHRDEEREMVKLDAGGC